MIEYLVGVRGGGGRGEGGGGGGRGRGSNTRLSIPSQYPGSSKTVSDVISISTHT
jgi:hypothetical protein